MGTYMGTSEFTQNVAGIRALEGEKRTFKITPNKRGDSKLQLIRCKKRVPFLFHLYI